MAYHNIQTPKSSCQLHQQFEVYLCYLTIFQLLEMPVVLNQSCIIFLGFYTSPLGSRQLFLQRLLRAGGSCGLLSSTFADWCITTLLEGRLALLFSRLVSELQTEQCLVLQAIVSR